MIELHVGMEKSVESRGKCDLHVGMEKSVESRGKCDLHVGMGKSELNMYKFFDYMCKWQHGDYTCRKILLITCRNGESGITHV